MDGLIDYDHNEGFRGPVATIDISDDWGPAVAAIKPLSDVPEWTLAVVLSIDGNDAPDRARGRTTTSRASCCPTGSTGTLAGADIKWVSKKLASILNVGDVIYVSPVAGKPGSYTLEQVPEIEGALVAMDPRTGRVLAMVGGFSYSESEFNRATQALRQPGSPFKPIVYSAALDNGYTPASVVLDAPLEIVNADGSVWRPENYAQDFYGPQTLRARHRTSPQRHDRAAGAGHRHAAGRRICRRCSASTTSSSRCWRWRWAPARPPTCKMTAAYATIANGGRKIAPTLIDRIQDRYGKTIYRHDERVCDGCNATELEQPERAADHRQSRAGARPDDRLPDHLDDGRRGAARHRHRRQAAQPAGRRQDRHLERLQGRLVHRLYARISRSASMSASTSRRNLGSSATGGGLAVPIFTEFMAKALKGKPPTPFNMPAGMSQVWIDPATGVKANAGAGGDRGGVQARHRAQPHHLGDRGRFQCLQQHRGPGPVPTAAASTIRRSTIRAMAGAGARCLAAADCSDRICALPGRPAIAAGSPRRRGRRRSARDWCAAARGGERSQGLRPGGRRISAKLAPLDRRQPGRRKSPIAVQSSDRRARHRAGTRRGGVGLAARRPAGNRSAGVGRDRLPRRNAAQRSRFASTDLPLASSCTKSNRCKASSFSRRSLA